MGRQASVKWWGYVALGLVWLAIVVFMAILSMQGAYQAVAAGDATAFGTQGVIAAVLSTTIFSLPGFIFLIIGVRKQRKGF